MATPTASPPTPAGALPTAWAGANRPLRMLTVLDVSFNYLGRQDNPAAADGFDYLPLPDSTDDWGKADRFKTPFPRLKTLDLGSNYFTGMPWGVQRGHLWTTWMCMEAGSPGWRGDMGSGDGQMGAAATKHEHGLG